MGEIRVGWEIDERGKNQLLQAHAPPSKYRWIERIAQVGPIAAKCPKHEQLARERGTPVGKRSTS